MDNTTATEINLKDDEEFRELLLSERAQMLSRVDAIEKFLDLDRTAEIRKLWKKQTYENYAGTVGDEVVK